MNAFGPPLLLLSMIGLWPSFWTRDQITQDAGVDAFHLFMNKPWRNVYTFSPEKELRMPAGSPCGGQGSWSGMCIHLASPSIQSESLSELTPYSLQFLQVTFTSFLLQDPSLCRATRDLDPLHFSMGTPSFA